MPRAPFDPEEAIIDQTCDAPTEKEQELYAKLAEVWNETVTEIGWLPAWNLLANFHLAIHNAAGPGVCGPFILRLYSAIIQDDAETAEFMNSEDKKPH